MNQLDGIKQFTTVVADSGDIESIRTTSRRMPRQILFTVESRRA
ncbi:transaldolase A [Salmonella enterica subsp. enterica]|nr:transaldolase A [Salmonella enterica subsp. enterica]